MTIEEKYNILVAELRKAASEEVPERDDEPCDSGNFNDCYDSGIYQGQIEGEVEFASKMLKLVGEE